MTEFKTKKKEVCLKDFQWTGLEEYVCLLLTSTVRSEKKDAWGDPARSVSLGENASCLNVQAISFIHSVNTHVVRLHVSTHCSQS